MATGAYQSGAGLRDAVIAAQAPLANALTQDDIVRRTQNAQQNAALSQNWGLFKGALGSVGDFLTGLTGNPAPATPVAAAVPSAKVLAPAKSNAAPPTTGDAAATPLTASGSAAMAAKVAQAYSRAGQPNPITSTPQMVRQAVAAAPAAPKGSPGDVFKGLPTDVALGLYGSLLSAPQHELSPAQRGGDLALEMTMRNWQDAQPNPSDTPQQAEYKARVRQQIQGGTTSMSIPQIFEGGNLLNAGIGARMATQGMPPASGVPYP